MLKPQGYITVTTPERTIERDSISCAHCNRIVIVKPGTAATVYLFPQMVGSDTEEAGAFCRQCMHAICLSCHADGRCIPLMRRIEAIEARGRHLQSLGIR